MNNWTSKLSKKALPILASDLLSGENKENVSNNTIPDFAFSGLSQKNSIIDLISTGKNLLNFEKRMVHEFPKKTNNNEVFIVGGGPQGLATGIHLLEEGFEVKLINSEEEVSAVSSRPDFNPFAIQHSGIYYAKDDSLEVQGCKYSFEILKKKENELSSVDKIFKDSLSPSGKIITSHSEKGSFALGALADRARKRNVENILLDTPKSLNEHVLTEVMGEPKIALLLPKVNSININKFHTDLKNKFLSKGGQLINGYAKEYIQKNDDLSLSYIQENQRKSVKSDFYINLAGLDNPRLARTAQKATSTGEYNPDADIPDVKFRKYYALHRKNDAALGYCLEPVVYSADNASDVNGNLTGSVGVHTYRSNKLFHDNKRNYTVGPFSFSCGEEEAKKILLEEVEERSKPITESIKNQFHNVLPDDDINDYELSLVGVIVQYPERSLKISHYNNEAGQKIINGFTSDSPGLTATPKISKEISKIVKEHHKNISEEHNKENQSNRSYYR